MQTITMGSTRIHFGAAVLPDGLTPNMLSNVLSAQGSKPFETNPSGRFTVQYTLPVALQQLCVPLSHGDTCYWVSQPLAQYVADRKPWKSRTVFLTFAHIFDDDDDDSTTEWLIAKIDVGIAIPPTPRECFAAFTSDPATEHLRLNREHHSQPMQQALKTEPPTDMYEYSRMFWRHYAWVRHNATMHSPTGHRKKHTERPHGW